MLQQLFGTELAFPIRVAVALAVIAALLGVTVLAMRRLGARGGAGAGAGRGRPGPRIAVVDSITVDQRRKLVLVRRDDVEHLLLIGGNSDIVVEPQIGVREEEASAASPAGFTAPNLTPAREAPALQRPVGRRGLSAAPAPAVLPAEAAPATLPAPQPAPAAAPAFRAPAAPVEAEAPPSAAPPAPPREERRAVLGRRPLLRGDGTLSGQAPQRAAMAPRPAPAAAVPGPSAPAAEAPVPLPREAEALRLPHAAEPKPAPAIELAHVPPPKAEAAHLAAAGSRLEVMAQRLDAALSQPAAPQLNLSDLLGEVADAQEEAAAEPPHRTADRAAEGPPERALSRFASQPRAPVEPRPRLDPLPRLDRQPEDAPRPGVAPRAEPSLRPREFSFRSRTEPAAPDLPRREGLPPREAAARDFAAARSLEAAPKPAESDAEAAKDEDAPQRPRAEAPPLSAEPRRAPASADDDAGPAAPEPKATEGTSPLDDFDAEMANLLGRSTARGR